LRRVGANTPIHNRRTPLWPFKESLVLLEHLAALPLAVAAIDDEVLELIERRKLWGTGIGWVNAHLLGSAVLSNCSLLTLDGPLRKSAARAKVELYPLKT
jgi:hypothetical protein